jgi:chromosome segregation ATPase
MDRTVMTIYGELMLKEFLTKERETREQALRNLLSRIADRKDNMALTQRELQDYADEDTEVSLQTEWLNTEYHATLRWKIERLQAEITEDEAAITNMEKRIEDIKQQLNDIDYELNLNG